MEPRPSVDDCKVMRFLGAIIKPVHPCTGLTARFAQQNALLLRTTDIRVGTEKKNTAGTKKYTKPDGKIVIAPAIVWGINATLFRYGVVASRNDEIGFAARHPIIAVQLGILQDGGRHGLNSAATNFAINSELSTSVFSE